MAHGYSGKTLTVAISGVTIATKGYTLDDTTKNVDVTSDGSGGKEEFAAGIEGGGGSARGFCDITTAPVKPTAAVTATFFDGNHTNAVLRLPSSVRKVLPRAMCSCSRRARPGGSWKADWLCASTPRHKGRMRLRHNRAIRTGRYTLCRVSEVFEIRSAPRLYLAGLSIAIPSLFALIALACLGLLAFGMYLQHVVGLNPCPMCIVQRYAMIGVLVLGLLGWRLRKALPLALLGVLLVL